MWLTARGKEKSSAQVAHRMLPDKESVVRAKEYWTGRLNALEQLLTS